MLEVQDQTAQRVEQGFEKLLDALKPRYSEPEEAEKSHHLIERCLSDSHGMAYLAPYGSAGHGTNVDGFSAIDSFAVISKDRLYEDSAKSLERIADVLSEHLPGISITDGRPVIVVPFGEKPSQAHHIVPAFVSGSRGEFDLYQMPGPGGRWIETCPGGHSAWINRRNEELNYKLKPFIRLAKAWNYGADAPIWSFYLEVAATDFMRKQSAGCFSADVQEFFVYLLKRRLDPFKTSQGSNEPVYATCLADKFDAMDRLRGASELAKKAWHSEYRHNAPDAYFWWRKLFHYQFPTY